MEASSKAAVRQQIRQVLAAVSPAERSALSLKVGEILRHQLAWREANSILGFAPLSDEPDMMPLLEESWASNKRVALPRYDADSSVYAACAVSTRNEISPGNFGLLEPVAGCPVVPLNQLDFILVPGVAFDLAGRRLGRGKGFYDRLLAGVHGHKCGVAFDAQIVAHLPEEPHDIRVDSILTPTRWHWCRRVA
ncbi:MAG TPA: 5-formyltetrahydrofolate cyclo-ligase [Verrucomicrobiae bacterium]|jgi:5-formyltetrahydrofolate cyclo-ligase